MVSIVVGILARVLISLQLPHIVHVVLLIFVLLIIE